MSKIIYKVYCGKNGKFYKYLSLVQAERLYTSLMLQNYHTAIDKIESGKTTRIKEHI